MASHSLDLNTQYFFPNLIFSTLIWIVSPDKLSHPFWSKRHKPQEMSLNSVKVPDEVPSIPKNVWTVRVRHQREYYPQIHVGGLLDMCLQEREPDIEIRASGQGQGSSSHVRSEDKSSYLIKE